MYRRAQPLLGTYVTIGISQYAANCAVERAVTDAFNEIESIHQLMSFQLPNSIVSQCNIAKVGAVIPVPMHVAHVLKRAIQLCQQTGGLFNPSIAPKLVQAGILPDITGCYKDAEIGRLDECLTVCQHNEVHIHRQLVMDLSGIAKGYAVDMAVHCLRRAGVYSGIVNAGGDLRVFGDYSTPIEIRHDGDIHESFGVLQQGAVATSGPYDRCHQQNKQRKKAHIVHGIEPVSLVMDKIVTVVAPNCIMADALTKLVYLTQDVTLPLLKRYGATAFIV